MPAMPNRPRSMKIRLPCRVCRAGMVTLLAACFVSVFSVEAAAAPTPAQRSAQAATKAATPTAKSKRAEAKKEQKPRPAPRVVTMAPSLPAQLKASLDTALNDPALDGAQVSFVAIDLDDGTLLADSGGDSLINPASNAKLITSAAALDALKPEYRFKTEYYVQGTLRDGTLNGNLVVKGFGDPTIVSERMMKVVNELSLFGIERITGGIIVDDTFFDSVEEARGWELEDAPDRAYAAPVSALMANYNAVAIYVRPAAEAGRPAIVKVDPPTDTVTLNAALSTELLGRGMRVVSDKRGTAHDVDGTVITVEGSISVREAPFRIYRRVWDPARHFGATLLTFLEQRGVKVGRRSITKAAVPAGARLVLVDRSEALSEVVADLNHYSNNIIAETLIKTIGAEVMGAPGTFDNGLLVARRYLEDKVGLQAGSYVFNNGSGLNDVNRFTARQLVRLLGTITRDYELSTEYTTSLAVAGTRGTIGFRMKDTPARRRLRAKTGTLQGVSALSGYVVQPNGHVVAFSILSQGFKHGASSVWKVQNAIGAAFASAGTWRPQGEEPSEEEALSSLGTASRPVEPALGGAP